MNSIFKTQRPILLDVVIPLLILSALTLMFWMTELDLAIEGLFYDVEAGWVHKGEYPWKFFDTFGPLPAFVLSGLSAGVLLASYWKRDLMRYRKMALFFVLLLLLGPGLIVNSIFKQHWGRPRPQYVQEFSGPNPFLHAWEKGPAGNGSSFASGHASTGFFLMAPFFVLRRLSKKWAYLSLLVGLSSGCMIGFARMIQGRHFPSDVVWAGGFVYLCGVGLYYLLGLHRDLYADEEWPLPALKAYFS